MPVNKETDPILAWFEKLARDERQPAWVFPMRKAALARFAETGYPTLEHEDWRFTNLAALAKLPFEPVLSPATDGLTRQALAPFLFRDVPGGQLVFVNGHFAAGLSRPAPVPKGVQVTTIAAALAAHDPLLAQHLPRSARLDQNPFSALNAAFFQDGAFIHVPAGQKVAEPVHLVFVNTAPRAGTTSHPRNVLVAGAHSQITVLESHVSLANAPYVVNTVTDFDVGDGATVEHLKFQDESESAFHIATLPMRVGAAANFISHSFALGARVSRHNIYALLAGDGSECVLNGLYLTRQEQVADHWMRVEHGKPHCASHEYFNGILQDSSRGVFHGRILVQPEAQKTDAKQTNKNLLLSETATVNTKPQLEIYADDVKCTHGATVGQLNEESIFYLRARGLSTETARRMLIHAFAGEIIERIRCEPVRDILNQRIWDRLEQNPEIAGHS